ncbi:MAG: FeoA domain-containing protein [Helicobacter sp.]|nr:FeoA domain-containing protein [Helicobacteraceae bacterium]MDY3114272.1 FeoA domain-containing protein [Helicobacter sp.]
MTIDALKDGECGMITKLVVNDELKDRFFTFGITKGKTIKKVRSSLGDSTILVELNRNCIILRASEAKSIEITPSVCDETCKI